MEQEIEIDLDGNVTSPWFHQETADIICSLCGKGGKGLANERLRGLNISLDEAINNECYRCVNSNPLCG
jgi:hypothetical protein